MIMDDLQQQREVVENNKRENIVSTRDRDHVCVEINSTSVSTVPVLFL